MATASLLGFQYAGTRELDLNFNNAGSGRHGAKTKDQFNNATNVGVYIEKQFDVDSEHRARSAAADSNTPGAPSTIIS